MKNFLNELNQFPLPPPNNLYIHSLVWLLFIVSIIVGILTDFGYTYIITGILCVVGFFLVIYQSDGKYRHLDHIEKIYHKFNKKIIEYDISNPVS